jgi:hypothetical protein
VVGPAFGAYSRQRLAGQGDDLSACVIEWGVKQARCPKVTRVRNGPQATMPPAPPSCASALIRRPVAPVRSATRAPGPQPPPAN